MRTGIINFIQLGIIFGVFLFVLISPNTGFAQDKLTDEQAKNLSQELVQKLHISFQTGGQLSEFDQLFLSAQDLDWMMQQYKSAKKDLSPKSIETAKKEMLERSSEARTTLQSLIGKVSNVELVNAAATFELNINWVGVEIRITTPQKIFISKFAAISNTKELKIITAPSI